MELRLLGRTGLRVSALSLGTMTFGPNVGWEAIGALGVEEAKDLVALALDSGINLFDTADIYSDGLSEEVLGRALGKRRDDVLVATKCHFRMGDGPNDVGSSRHYIIRACEASLRRLGSDHIDLFQLHGPDEVTDVEQTVRALDDLVTAGKVRYVGCSNYSAWHLMKALAAADARGLERFASLQAYYNLVARELEHELVPLSLDQGVAILVWSPLAGGLLSGKTRRGSDPPPGTRTATYGPEGTVDMERFYDIVDVLSDIAEQRGVSIPQIVINWLLAKPGVTSVILGARNLSQLADNLQAATWCLSGEDLARLDDVSARPLPYPYFHQQGENSERMRVLAAHPHD